MARFDVAGDELILHVSLLREARWIRPRRCADPARPRSGGARAVEDPWAELRGIRSPGTGWPKRIALGTWRFSGGKDFVALYEAPTRRRGRAWSASTSRASSSPRRHAEAVAEEIDGAARSPLRAQA